MMMEEGEEEEEGMQMQSFGAAMPRAKMSAPGGAPARKSKAPAKTVQVAGKKRLNDEVSTKLYKLSKK